MMSRAQ